MKNLIIRTITGVAFVAIMVFGILHSPASFATLFTIITVLSVWEFTGIVNQRPDVSVNRFITTVAGGCLFVGFFGYSFGISGAGVLFVPWLLSMVYMLVAELYLQRESPLNNWAYAMMSQLYVALPFSLLCLIVNPDISANTTTPETQGAATWLVLAIYVLLWLNDSGAYCVGSLLGRHKLFPRISPGKSWEGSVGGAVFVLAMGRFYRWRRIMHHRCAHRFTEPDIDVARAVGRFRPRRRRFRNVGRPHRELAQTPNGHKGQRQHPAWPRRYARPV